MSNKSNRSNRSNRSNLGSIWDSIGDHFGFILGSIWDHFGVILGFILGAIFVYQILTLSSALCARLGHLWPKGLLRGY